MCEKDHFARVITMLEKRHAPPFRDCVVTSLRVSEATEAISLCFDEITHPVGVRDDRYGTFLSQLWRLARSLQKFGERRWTIIDFQSRSGKTAGAG